MRRFITDLGKFRSNAATIVNWAPFRRIACLAALASGLALTQGFAKEPAEPEVRPISKSNPASATGLTAEAGIPACLEKLKLTQPQQAQAKEVVHKYDASIDAAWKRFGEKYMETVRIEVALPAAIEDNLTEAHRPLGGINRVRRRAYALSSAWRCQQAGVKLEEPA